jgi:hypothetical protein
MVYLIALSTSGKSSIINWTRRKSRGLKIKRCHHLTPRREKDEARKLDSVSGGTGRMLFLGGL